MPVTQFTQSLSKQLDAPQKTPILVVSEFGMGAAAKIKQSLRDIEDSTQDKVWFLEVGVDEISSYMTSRYNTNQHPPPLVNLAQSELSVLLVDMRHQFNKDVAIDLALKKDFEGVDLTNTVIVLVELPEDIPFISQNTLAEFEIINFNDSSPTSSKSIQEKNKQRIKL